MFAPRRPTAAPLVAFRNIPAPLAGLLVVLLAGCAPSEEESAYLARKALVVRQNQGIRELIAEAESTSLVPTGRFLVGLDEVVVAGLLRTQLPLESPVGKHFVIRLEKAEVSFRDKFGLVILDGELHRPATPDRKTAIRIHGGLGDVAIDPATGLLSLQLAIDHIELLRAGVLEGILGRTGRKFLAEAGRGLLQEALPKIEVPVALAQNIPIPAIQEAGIELDSLVIPLEVSVERVLAAGGKLWVTVDAEVGQVTGAEEGVEVAIQKKRKAPPGAPRDSLAPETAPDTGGA